MQNFETTTELLPHQVAAVEKMRPTRVGGLFMDMGTGKSRTAIELARIRSRKIDKVIWFCPVSLKDTVMREIAKHTDCRDICVFDGKVTSKTIPEVRWYIVGIESMSASARVVSAVHQLVTERTMVICDESSYIKGHCAKRTERITYISSKARYRLALTGTPISQGVVDLYAQMYFLSPKILGYSSFYSFAANHLEYSEQHPGMIVRSHNTKYLAEKIKPYVYQVTKDECITLPPKLYTTMTCGLTFDQMEWYGWVKEQAFDELDRDEHKTDWFTSVAIFRLFTALQEIASGFLNWRGEHHELHTKRPQLLVDATHRLPDPEKAVVFCKFAYDIDRIVKALTEEYGDGLVVWFDGRKNEKQRARAIDQLRGEARFLVVTQATGGHGFNLQDAAHYAIFYNNGFKYSERLQAEDRIHRLGQTQKTTYIDIYCSCGIEERIQDAMTRKGNAVRSFREQVKKVKDDKIKLKELIKSL